MRIFLSLFLICSVKVAANAGNSSNKALRSWYCPLACSGCPPASPDSETLCMISPFWVEFPCLCLIHTAICKGYAHTAIFYEGKCDRNPYVHVDNANLSLLTVREGKPVLLRHNADAAPMPKLLTDKTHTTTSRSRSQRCPNFSRTAGYGGSTNVHFQCITVDESKTIPLPPLA